MTKRHFELRDGSWPWNGHLLAGVGYDITGWSRMDGYLCLVPALLA